MKFHKTSFLSLFFLIITLLLNSCFESSGTGSSANNESDTDSRFFNDSLYYLQWHLKNSGQVGGLVGEDINVEPVWELGILGDGVVVVVVDDGMEGTHEDLSSNFRSDLTYNFVTPNVYRRHGNAVAGLIAARGGNSKGIRGVAPNASLVRYNLMDSSVTNSELLTAMSYNYSLFSVSNNSWGPDDYIGTFATAPSVWEEGIKTGLKDGRGGKGTIYIWAAGNGGQYNVDNSNYDGNANFYGVVAVNAIGHDGKKAEYAERGANILVSSHSLKSTSEPQKGLLTTDLTGGLGYNFSTLLDDIDNLSYTRTFGGTSGAAPIVAGVAALILEANPDLGWRDVREILATTARKNDPNDSEWLRNSAGYWIHPYYGFGVVDAHAAVEAALSWENLDSLVEDQDGEVGEGVEFSTLDNLEDKIDVNDTLESTIVVSSSGISKIEFVEVNVDITHDDWGELEIVLTRGQLIQTSSTLSKLHNCYDYFSLSDPTAIIDCEVDTLPWRFGTVRHLGESADATWTLSIRNNSNMDSGTLNKWSFTIWGRE